MTRIINSPILDVKVRFNKKRIEKLRFGKRRSGYSGDTFKGEMMITQTAEYALRAIAFLAKDPLRSHVTRSIAEATQVPADYLAKVLQTLVRTELVHSRRGQGGGFTLARTPEDISILDVVNAVDPLQRIRSCPLDLPEHQESLCPLHRRLDLAMADIEKALGATTIADIKIGPEGRVPLGKMALPAPPAGPEAS